MKAKQIMEQENHVLYLSATFGIYEKKFGLCCDFILNDK